MPNEFDFINHLKSKTLTDSSTTGIGDDAAIIPQHSSRETVITQDLLIEDIDFRRAWLPLKHLARALGHKALAVSLSDIAAMGATPRYCLTSIGLPEDVWRTKFIDDFYTSLLALAARHNVQLIGGDTSRSPSHIVIDCVVIGETAKRKSIKRSGAKPGDLIFVTGTLGGAAAGLKLLENGKRLSTGRTANASLSSMDALISRQLTPRPRTQWGMFLGEKRLASSMIDLSDGLSSDLHHLCQASRTGALIHLARLPVDSHINVVHLSDDAPALALSGGEDYELLFTVPERQAGHLPREIDGTPAAHIGIIVERSQGVKIEVEGKIQTLAARGFVHFSDTKQRRKSDAQAKRNVGHLP